MAYPLLFSILLEFLHGLELSVIFAAFAVFHEGKSGSPTLFFQSFVVFVELSHVAETLALAALQSDCLTWTFFLRWHKSP